jgi:hypothetical protein
MKRDQLWRESKDAKFSWYYYYDTTFILNDYLANEDLLALCRNMLRRFCLLQTITLPFSFRFYGHNITNVTVATGGECTCVTSNMFFWQAV